MKKFWSVKMAKNYTLLVEEIYKKFPNVDILAEQILSQHVRDWPSHVFMPQSAWFTIAEAHNVNPTDAQTGVDLSQLPTLVTWRYSQGIYDIDKTLLEELKLTDITGKIPCDFLRRLPEWAIYVPVNLEYKNHPIFGFWASIELTPNGDECLFLVFNFGSETVPTMILLGDWTLSEAHEKLYEALGSAGEGIPRENSMHKIMGQCVSILIYICSEQPVPDHPDQPIPKPTPTRKKSLTGKWRLFPARKTTVHKMGNGIGKQLREAQRASERESLNPNPDATRSVTPHVRRGHWHSFWTGARDSVRTIIVKWLHPILVGRGKND